MTAPCPKQLLTASGKLLDASNSAAPTLTAHKHAIEAKRADDAAKRHGHQHLAPTPSESSRGSQSDATTPSLATAPPSEFPDSPPVANESDESDFERQQPHRCFGTHHHCKTDFQITPGRKKPRVQEVVSDDETSIQNPRTPAQTLENSKEDSVPVQGKSDYLVLHHDCN